MKGWLFDIYHSKDRIFLWLKTEKGKTKMIRKIWKPNFYVNGSEKDLEKLESDLKGKNSVRELKWKLKRTDLQTESESKVLKIICESTGKKQDMAREIIRRGNFKKFRLFNVDVSPTQKYLFERKIFPMGKIRLKNLFNPDIQPIDSAEKTRYEIPNLESIMLEVEGEKNRKYHDLNKPISRIELETDDGTAAIEKSDEKRMILDLIGLIEERDPDIILTRGGDKWDFPYLAKRAKINNISEKLILGREKRPLKYDDREGVSYFSYGRTYHRAAPHHLKGRIHVDKENSFIYQKCGLEGLMELSRISKTPVQKTARNSIGSIMTNLQLFKAWKKGILIPWKKRKSERFKSALKLIDADRGGFIFEPEAGLHENVGEIDFDSFYPAIMEKYNISPETVLCDCCKNSNRKVPELNYNICELKRGLIPRVLEPVLEKRQEYKELLRKAGRSEKLKFEKRQKALKWILVTSFGYLGYRNAKFGRIEAHESVTAYARKNLKLASKSAENAGYSVVHGIVDSLWVKKERKSAPGLNELCRKIENKIGLPINFEGKYRWIIFLREKNHSKKPAVNKYYGLLNGERIKSRGILSRKSDTPLIVSKAQKNILKNLSKAKEKNKLSSKAEKALDTSKEYVKKIRTGKAKPKELAVEKRLSKIPSEYERDSRCAIAARKLEESGVHVKAGESVRFIVKNRNAKDPTRRVKPLLLFSKEERYDSKWYMKRLVDSIFEVLKPLGYSRHEIKSKVLGEKKQEKLRR